jgi:hypothetical protein
MLPYVGYRCQFCQTALKAMDPFDEKVLHQYIHFHCPKKCCKVMRPKIGDWVLFRVYLDKHSSVEIDRRVSEKFCYKNYSKGTAIYLPNFDINNLSLLKLKNKIKKYLLFS